MVDPELIRETFNQTDKPLMAKLDEVTALGRDDALAEVVEMLENLRWERQRLLHTDDRKLAILEEIIDAIGQL